MPSYSGQEDVIHASYSSNDVIYIESDAEEHMEIHFDVGLDTNTPGVPAEDLRVDFIRLSDLVKMDDPASVNLIEYFRKNFDI